MSDGSAGFVAPCHTEVLLNQFTRNLMLWGIISLAMVIVFNLFSQPQHSNQPSVTYSEFLRQAAKGEVSEVVIQGNNITGKLTDGKSFQIYVPNDPGLVDKLIAEKVEVRAEPVEDSPWYMTLLARYRIRARRAHPVLRPAHPLCLSRLP